MGLMDFIRDGGGLLDGMVSDGSYRTELPGVRGMAVQTPMSVRGLNAVGDFIPGYGDIKAVGEAGSAWSEGDLAAAGLLSAGAIVGLVPGAGDAIARPIIAAGRKASDVAVPAARNLGQFLVDDAGALRIDNPGGDWLKSKIKWANHDAANPRRPFDKTRLNGSVTGYYNNLLDIPVSRFESVPGASGEARRLGEAQYDRLAETVASEGWRPTPILAGVNDEGVPYVIEGNTRLALARDLGVDTIPAEIKYWNGGEAVDGIFSPSQMANFERPSLPAPTNDAERMAKRVLDLRGAGRASEVTEDMMAAADPSYMFRNTPLDMSQEARMARLDEYWPDEAYHGTPVDFPAVDREALGGMDIRGRGFNTSTNPDRAARYSGGRGVVMPVRLNNPTPLDTMDRASAADIENFLSAADDLGFETTSTLSGRTIGRSGVEPEMFFPDNFLGDIQGNINRSVGPGAGSDILEAAGYTGVKAPEGFGHVQDVIFDPTNIRSIFARADPEFRHLANLSAGLGGIGLLGSMNRDDLDRETAAYLGGI